jgi:hypothetical protein
MGCVVIFVIFMKYSSDGWQSVEIRGRTRERSDDVPASVIYGEFWIAGAALRLIRPQLLFQRADSQKSG